MSELLLETRTPQQLGLATSVSAAALTVVQEPDGPVEGLEVGRLLGLLYKTDVVYETRAELFADLAHDANAIGYVYADPDPGKSGYYQKSGASGAGAWALIGIDALTLRQQLDEDTGAGHVRASDGRTVEDNLSDLIANQALLLTSLKDTQLANPPYNEGASNWQDMVPTELNPTISGRLSATLILSRTLRPDGTIDEFILGDPAGFNGLNAGWFLLAHRAVDPLGRMWTWLVQNAIPALQTETDWVLNIGKSSGDYLDGEGGTGNGPDFYYAAKAHGHVLSEAANQIIKVDGAGTNLQDVANWPVGERLAGDTLDFESTYTLAYGDVGGEDAATVFISRQIGSTFGERVIGNLTPVHSEFAFNDSYLALMAVSRGGSADTMKLAGDPLVIPLVGETNPALQQKGNWDNAATVKMQAYSSRDPRAICAMSTLYGPPLRKQGGGGVGPWGYNELRRVVAFDRPDAGKFAVFAASTPELPPKVPIAVPTTTTLEWFNIRGTAWSEAGPE